MLAAAHQPVSTAEGVTAARKGGGQRPAALYGVRDEREGHWSIGGGHLSDGDCCTSSRVSAQLSHNAVVGPPSLSLCDGTQSVQRCQRDPCHAAHIILFPLGEAFQADVESFSSCRGTLRQRCHVDTVGLSRVGEPRRCGRPVGANSARVVRVGSRCSAAKRRLFFPVVVVTARCDGDGLCVSLRLRRFCLSVCGLATPRLPLWPPPLNGLAWKGRTCLLVHLHRPYIYIYTGVCVCVCARAPL